MTKITLHCFSISLALQLFSTSSMAGGFRLPEYTAAGVATSNALVADAERISAIAYNPAIMNIVAQDPEQSSLFSTNLTHINYETEVTSGGTTTQGTGKTDFDVPNLFVSNRISEKFSIGLLIHSPFGLETAWPTNTFTSFGGTAALEPNLSRIKMFNANVNFGYKVDNETGLSIGLNQYRLLDLQFNSHATVIQGTGTGYGWNAAIISKLDDSVTLGMSYRSPVKTRATGTAASVLPVEVDVTFPEMLSAGINYAVNHKLKLELDVEYTGWKKFDNLNIRRQTNDSTLTLSTNNWKNTLTYRASGQYKINKHQILFGYSYDETPQEDSSYSARIPDADRQLFSIGYQYDFGSYQFETGLMLVKFKERTINSSTAYVAASEANGTTAYNGTYQAGATVLSIGMNVAF